MITPADLVADESTAEMEAAVGELDETERTTVETAVLTEAGKRRHYEFTLRRITSGEEPAYGGIGRDITAEKQAQREREAISLIWMITSSTTMQPLDLSSRP